MNPSDLPASPPSTPISNPAPNAAAPRILVVEDDLISQKVMMNLLKRKGWEPAAVVDGPQCLAALTREPFDLILMDLQLPAMDGFQTALRIRTLEAEQQAAGQSRRRVPIVALTTVAQPGTRQRCLESGMDEHLTKPVNTAQLYETVQRLLA